MTIADKIKQYMEVNNIKSVAEFATMSKLPYMTVKNIIDDNNNNIRRDTLLKLKDTMQITLDELADNNIDVNFQNKKNNDYINNKINVADNTVIFIGRGGNRSIYEISETDAQLVDDFLKRVSVKSK
ncbi:MAG: hypothetical protein IJ301_03835 [Clostridia bacterium]|nr:hypothetical protein [Clostridia bacterium]